jgi:D-3-phosphoglycerate dehydrogenase / 2-oxoglutarate reductase
LSCALEDASDRAEFLSQVQQITDLGMAGKIEFKESLLRRLSMSKIHRQHIQKVSESIQKNITNGMHELLNYLQSQGSHIFLISGGFLDVIFPVAEILGIPKEHCFANTFFFDNEGFVSGIDEKNPLSTGSGKSVVIESIASRFSPKPITILVGDGANDLRVFEIGKVDFFLGFGKNIVREEVRSKAVHFFYDTPPLQSFLESFFLQ